MLGATTRCDKAGDRVGADAGAREINGREATVPVIRSVVPAWHGGTMTSSDGLAWSDPVIYDWPDPPQRYDTSNNIFFDPALKRYVATTRRHPTTAVADGDRAIGIALSAPGSFVFNSSGELPLVLKGNHTHQIYAMETFKFHQLYMGIAMVYDATDSVNGRVHCRLVWSKRVGRCCGIYMMPRG